MSGEKTVSVCFFKGIRLAAGIFAAKLRRTFALLSIFTVDLISTILNFFGGGVCVLLFPQKIYIGKDFYHFVWVMDEDQVLSK